MPRGRRIAVILEGGPGAGKTSVARILAEALSRHSLTACIVEDAARPIAGLLSRLFGDWSKAPRRLVEYMILGYQVARLAECSGSDVTILDYSIDAPLAYMEADGEQYPRELDGLGVEALRNYVVYIFVLEQPTCYATDDARWEPPIIAARYTRTLLRRAARMASMLGAPIYVIPERRDPRERASMIIKLLGEHGVIKS